MPGDLIKLFDTQADWQSGTVEGLDATSTPGLVIPTGDYSKVYDSKADWDTGSKSGVVSTDENEISLPTMDWKTMILTASSGAPSYAVDGDDETFWEADTAENEWLLFDYGTCKPIVSSLTIKLYGSGLKDFRLEGSNDALDWTTLLSATAANSSSDQEWDIETPNAYRYYRLYCIDTYYSYTEVAISEVALTIQSYYLSPGTWTSAWLAHGIVSPQSGFLSLVKESPAGTAVTPHVRYSSDGGTTYTDWTELTNARLPGLTGSHVQIRLTLTTDDPAGTPRVSKATLLVGSIHRWTSPAIDTVDAGDTFMLAISQTDLDVQMEIIAGEDQYYFVSPLQPSILETSWGFVGLAFTNPKWTSIQFRLTLIKTGTEEQSLDSVALWDAVDIKMLDRPQITLSPPQVTHVTAYAENAEPAVEYMASVAVDATKKVHIRVAVPEGSNLSYCQTVAEKVLAAKSKERLSLSCRVPLLTRLRFSELVAVSIPFIGYTKAKPYLARVQKMAHKPIAKPPHTEVHLGDFLPDDVEAILRLIKERR